LEGSGGVKRKLGAKEGANRAIEPTNRSKERREVRVAKFLEDIFD